MSIPHHPLTCYRKEFVFSSGSMLCFTVTPQCWIFDFKTCRCNSSAADQAYWAHPQGPEGSGIRVRLVQNPFLKSKLTFLYEKSITSTQWPQSVAQWPHKDRKQLGVTKQHKIRHRIITKRHTATRKRCKTTTQCDKKSITRHKITTDDTKRP